MADVAQIDRQRAKAFMLRTMGMLNDAAVVQMMSVGNRTGLFDAMAGLDAATSAEIAAAAGLQERYVREWLGAMVSGRVVDYDPDTATYVLPPEHARCLTTSAGPRNLTGMAKMLFATARVEPLVVDCFRHGGGVPYEAYDEFHRLQRELSGAVQDASLIDVVLPLIDGMPDRLAAGIDVADVGCGAGHAVNLMARAFPASRFVGFDFSTEAVDMARAEAAAMGLGNARFEAVDVARLDEHGRYDLITTFDAIHDQARPAEVLAAIARALAEDGVWLCVDIAGSSHVENNLDHPMAPFFYTGSTMHCMTVSLAYDGEGLGAMWGEEKARELFTDAGFRSIEVHHVPGDSVNNYYVCRT
jgi:SAM-dependent methyltransferase